MKKILLSLVLATFFSHASAQNLNYGVILGTHLYDVEIDGPMSGSGGMGINFGGFVDYKFTKSFGIRGNVIYSIVKEQEYTVAGPGFYETIFREAKSTNLQLHTLLKYDVNKSYDKGFYLLGGLKVTNVLNAKFDDQENDDFYMPTTFGAMLGFGTKFSKDLSLEIIPTVNLINTLDSNSNKSKNYGFYAQLLIDLDFLSEKK